MTYEGAIGIDLGTTYSCVGVWQNERVEIIANDQGNRTTPSYVAFTDTERLIGDAAKNQVAMNPTNTVFDAKRLIGRKFSDPVVQSDMKHWPFKVITKGDDKPVIQVQFRGETKTFNPEEVSSMVLSKMKEIAGVVPGQAGEEGRGDGARVLQRLPATGDEGCPARSRGWRCCASSMSRQLPPLRTAWTKWRTARNAMCSSFDLGGGTFDVHAADDRRVASLR
ncbi:putative heat shock protein 70 (hsp70) [Trypanosoma cruzi]|uniref:Putative heat shock protein 70 (Hsp70) n=1 Tax=Trypanosoma cruzi TaxID=5693 RepID=A0A2V2UJC7_TRYCR|nr:putative heat shock protein 70 (hsp70) [Trypanosoma cruzi]